MSEEKQIDLKQPFKNKVGETVSSLTMQPPKGKHMRGLKADMDFGTLLGLGEKLCGFTPRSFDEMSAPDCLAVIEAVGDFLDPGQEK
jgi:hypothetical protein